MHDFSGQVIKGYELREHIGSGGFGAVYRAYQPVVEREVAIKIILQQYANQPEFIRRFQAEAQVIARLEHSHIVPLYDYWREPEGAYLVMRWLRGGSLRNLLGRGPLPPHDVVRITDQLAGALNTAHRRQIVHRDLKPDNVLLDEEGNVYLADFGLAIDIATGPDPSEGEGISGSPAYLSPEQISGKDLTHRADIYAMGIILYELLCGERPFPGLSGTQLLQKHLYDPLPALRERQPNLPDEVETVLQTATAKEADDRYPNMVSLAQSLRQALFPAEMPVMMPVERSIETSTAEAVISTSEYDATLMDQDRSGLELENPYMGLRAFQEADAGHFFGREELIAHLLGRLTDGDKSGTQGRFLAVIGPSGSGKSSIVKAGVIPAIRRGDLHGSQRWFIAEMTPGKSPLDELGQALLNIATAPGLAVSADLRSGKQSFAQIVAQVLPPDPKVELLLVIDQFEELFTLTEDVAERQRFLDSLLDAATHADSRVRTIITLRADFYDRPLMYPEFGPLVRQSTEVVLPPARTELALAIVGPAGQVGLEIEPGLVQNMLADLENQPGALPLLQYALTELFERRNGRLLTIEAYQESGGVLGALGRRAEDLYEHQDAALQELSQQLFLRLVALGEGSDDTRRRVPRTELSTLRADRQQFDQVLDTFGRYRLLTFDRDPITRVPTIEVAHEALIRTWQRLRTWLDANREDLYMARRVSAAAGEWTQAQRDPSFLASGSRLDQFETWMAETRLVLNTEELDYLHASIAQREAQRKLDEQRKAHETALELRSRNRLRALAGVLTAATVVALVLTGFAVNRQQIADTNAHIANDNAATATIAQGEAVQNAAVAQANFTHAESLRLAAEANTIMQTAGGNSELAALLSVRAMKLGYSPQADSAVLRAESLNLARRQLIGHKDAVQSVAFSPDSSQALTASWDKTIRLWDVQTGTQLREFRGHKDIVSSAVFSPDGRYVLSSSVDQTIRLWDAQTGEAIRTFSGHKGAVTDAIFSPDGKQVLSCGEDGTIRLWDTQTGTELRRFVGGKAAVYTVAFSPDGTQIVSGAGDYTASVWNVSSDTPVQRLEGHKDIVRSVAFSPDGNQVLTGSLDNTAVLWDAHSGQKLRTFTGHNYSISSVAFSSDGLEIVTGSYDGTARRWDVRTGAVRTFYTGPTTWVLGVALSPDNRWLLVGAKDGTVRLWANTPNAGELRLLKFADQVEYVALSPDDQQLLVSVKDGTAQLFDRQTAARLKIFSGHTDLVTRGIFSPDGKFIFTASVDKTIRQWDVQTGQTVKIFSGHTDIIEDLAISPDGKQLISGSNDGTARLWDVATGQELQHFQIPAVNGIRVVFAVAFSPDGKQVLVSGSNGVIDEYDTITGQRVRQFGVSSQTEPGLVPIALRAQTAPPMILSIAFSPDGKQVLAGDETGKAHVWNAQSGKLLFTLAGHVKGILGVHYSHDGTIISTSSMDATIRLWDAQTAAPLRTLTGHSDSVRIAIFTQDDQRIYSASRDGTARAWEARYEDTVQYLCSRVVRDLSDEERSKYSIQDHNFSCSP